MVEETREEWKARMRSISIMGGGRPSKRNTTEWKDPVDGHRVKRTVDEVTERGNLVTEHNTKDDRVDVLVRPDPIKYGLGRKP